MGGKTYEQADFLSVALLGQFSHEQAPGAQEQTSPHLLISHYSEREEGPEGEVKG